MSFQHFQNHFELFHKHVVQLMSETEEYKDISAQLQSLLVLGDRVLFACERHPHFSRIMNLTKLLDRAETTPHSFSNFEDDEYSNILLELEKWMKALLYFTFPEKYEKLIQEKGRFTYFPAIREMELLTQVELDLKEEKSLEGTENEVRWFIYLTKKARDFETHNTHEQKMRIQNNYLTAILVTLIAPLYKHYDCLKKRLQGLVTAPINSEVEFLISQVNSERTRHSNGFAAREDWVNLIVEKLEGDLRTEGGYLVLTGTEGMGKSALCAKIAERLCRDREIFGSNANYVRRNAPWLPGVLLHFGKSSKHPLEIVRSLVAQINTMLLQSIELPEVNAQQSFEFMDVYRDYEHSIKRRAAGGEMFSYEQEISYLSDTQGERQFGRRKEYFDSNHRGLYKSDYVTAPAQLKIASVSDMPYQQANTLEKNIEYYQRVLFTALDRLVQIYGPTTLIIDALDEISLKTDVLEFLPKQLPLGVSAFLTTRPNLGIDSWLQRTRFAIPQGLDYLGEEEIPLITKVDSNLGEEERAFNNRVWKVSEGLPLHVASIARAIVDVGGDFSKVNIEESVNGVLHEQAQKWTFVLTGNEGFDIDVLREVLILLAIFEPVASLQLDDVFGYLQHKGIPMNKAQIRQVLTKVGYQLEGMNTKQERIKLSLKTFADHVRDTYYGYRETKNALQDIVNWLITDSEVGEELIARFLQYWMDKSQVKPKRLCQVAEEIILTFKTENRIDKLKRLANSTRQDQGISSPLFIRLARELTEFDEPVYIHALARYYSNEEEDAKNQNEVYKLLRRSCELNYYPAMIDLGLRLIEGYGISQDIVEGEAWLRKASASGDEDAKLILAKYLIDGERIAANYEEGESLLIELMDNGFESAKIVYAKRLIEGNGLSKDVPKGLHVLEEAAEEGFTGAMLVLGHLLMKGKDVEQNLLEAEKWLIKAASQDFIPAIFLLGIAYIEAKELECNIEDGIHWLKKAAGLGMEEAMIYLSNLYFRGEVVKQADYEGERWLRKAAESGEKEAMFELGIRMLEGEGVSKNKKEGENWLKKVVDAGSNEAAVDLGERYINGDGVMRNKVAGEKYLRKAANQKFVPSYVTLGDFLLSSSKLRKDIIEGEKWLRKGVNADSPSAMYELSRYLFEGDKLKKNLVEAEELLRRAVEKNYVLAQYSLGMMILKGIFVAQTPGEGEVLLRMVAEKRPDAMCSLATFLIEGTGVEKNVEEAISWFRRAAETGDVDSMSYYGGKLLLGETIPQDVEEGEKLLVNAYEKGDEEAANMLGVYYYEQQDFHKALKHFIRGHELGSSNCDTSLAYMLRRNEVPAEYNLPSIKDLLESAVSKGSVVAKINQALSIYQQHDDDGSWFKADKIMKTLTGDIEEAVGWWHERAKLGDAEGHLVIGWLVYHNKITDPDSMIPRNRFVEATMGGWRIPKSFLKRLGSVASV
ncbi:hypothetical protein CN268_20030 [Bacillus anthracis]|nr:hypothetical protein CN268_20030 [Bacillus anthracis]